MKVLISPGFGAGWSTWNTPEIAVDEDLIELFEQGCTEEEMAEVCVKKGYTMPYGSSIYMGGFNDLKVAEVPQGSYFTIREYDGSESIEILNLDDWFYAED